jgi:hypothetical protein
MSSKYAKILEALDAIEKSASKLDEKQKFYIQIYFPKM